MDRQLERALHRHSALRTYTRRKILILKIFSRETAARVKVKGR